MSVKKWISGTLTTILTIVLITVLYFSLSSRILGTTPNLFGYQFYAVQSGSMEPGIQTGSIIMVQPDSKSIQYKKGDVITFHKPGDSKMLITHRIVDVQKGKRSIEYVTRGDNNQANDPYPVPVSMVVGKYADLTVPYVGYAVDFAKTKVGIVLFLIVPGAAVIIWQLISLFITISRLDKARIEKTPEVH